MPMPVCIRRRNHLLTKMTCRDFSTKCSHRSADRSVAGGERTETLAHWFQRRWGVVLERVAARAHQLGVTNRYIEPERLGADRWAALLATRTRVGAAACVVDCGTAVTIDALDGDGVFRGGVILPGLSVQRASLHGATHGIRVSEGDTQTCFARTTADAVSAGTLYGLAGAIDRILDEQFESLGSGVRVLLTGGDAPVIAPRLRHAVELAPDLVLEGVWRIACAREVPA
jgi:type III pantothenate kinase